VKLYSSGGDDDFGKSALSLAISTDQLDVAVLLKSYCEDWRATDDTWCRSAPMSQEMRYLLVEDAEEQDSLSTTIDDATVRRKICEALNRNGSWEQLAEMFDLCGSSSSSDAWWKTGDDGDHNPAHSILQLLAV